ncbi:MAG TPA: hypothetical protein VNW92_01285, partial [Polyangiaceae bacterium]|nr:hypothetical protein [Polyangiaceae bacterium]
LALGAFEACSTSTDTTIAPAGPPDIAIVTPLDSLGCDNSLVVHLTLTNWFLKPPSNCGTTPQCGTVQVTLLETPDGPPLASQRAATSDVQLDLSALVSPKAGGPTLSQVHYIKAQFFNDSLTPYVTSAGHSSQLCGAGQADCPLSVSISPPASCSGEGGANAGGAAGAAGATSANAGASGAPAEGGTGGTAGAAGGSAAEAGAGGEVAASGAAPI